MPSDCISFRDTNYFSSLICDYLEEQEHLKPFYNRFPKIENFKAQIEEKRASFSNNTRRVLVNSLKRQYQDIHISSATLDNIELLDNATTFTVTTGHQLNLFTGPLYFLYKIVSAINLSKELKVKYPDYDFVPVYWMATEDHDFEEINYFNFQGKKIQWSKESSGGVGRLSTEGLEDVFKVFASELNSSNNANTIKELFENAYIKHTTLTEATRYLANELFKAYGLVIVDGDDKDLKSLFVPYVEEELTNQISFATVTETSAKLDKVQVNPREINLFYLEEGVRERIVFEEGQYRVLNTDISWNNTDIKKALIEHPEKFSPNVIMRPLYQEVILPNLCYIGGGGELAYWMQLKNYFNTVKVPFPVLLLRNSVLIQTKKQAKKLNNLGVSLKDRFLKQDDLIKKHVQSLTNFEIDFTTQKEHLKAQFETMFTLAEKTDGSFKTAVAAQERKQIKGLENLEKKLLRAQKRKLSEDVARLKIVQNELFPNQSLQERNTNFSEFYLEHGEALIPKLIEELNPLKGKFTVITL